MLKTKLFLIVAILLPAMANAQPFLAQHRAEVTDLMGNPISMVNVGEEFYMNLYTQDLRDNPLGVFAAFADIVLDPSLTADEPEFFDPYLNAQSFTSGSDYIPNAGAVAGVNPLGGQEFLVLRATVTASEAGLAFIDLLPAMDQIQHATLLYGLNDRLDPAQVEFLGTQVKVVPEPALLPWFALVGLAAARRWRP